MLIVNRFAPRNRLQILLVFRRARDLVEYACSHVFWLSSRSKYTGYLITPHLPECQDTPFKLTRTRRSRISFLCLVTSSRLFAGDIA